MRQIPYPPPGEILLEEFLKPMGIRAPLQIQSSPKCKARGKFSSAAYALYVSKKLSPQRSSWDEIWIFRGVHYPISAGHRH